MTVTPAAPGELDAAAIEWLLTSDEPGIRMQARRDLLSEDASDDAARVVDGPIVRRFFEGQRAGGGFGANVYSKWRGAHWRLVSLVELGIPAGEPRSLAAVETVAHWLASRRHLDTVPVIDGRARHCASLEGNALAVMTRLGMAGDPRAQLLAKSLIGWQWAAGGWNCDRREAVTHPSFYETATPFWGLAEFALATGDVAAAEAVRRTAEFFLEHHVFQSHRTGRPGDRRWIGLHWPPYYGYDIGWGLTLLARAGALPDERAAEAVTWLRNRQDADGRWHVDGPWAWRSEGMRRADRDPALWPRAIQDQMATLNALRALQLAETPVSLQARRLLPLGRSCR
jgi:hypothetical protein